MINDHNTSHEQLMRDLIRLMLGVLGFELHCRKYTFARVSKDNFE